jgi:hypothetical protein
MGKGIFLSNCVSVLKGFSRNKKTIHPVKGRDGPSDKQSQMEERRTFTVSRNIHVVTE